MSHNNFSELLSESRRIYTKSILCEKVSHYISKTLMHIEESLGRELSQDEIENILILLTDENTN